MHEIALPFPNILGSTDFPGSAWSIPAVIGVWGALTGP